MNSPEKLASNIFYHSLVVTHWGWGRTGFLGCARAVRKKAKELGVDLVHGQGTERDSGVAAAMCGFPNLITLHGIMKRLHELNLHGSSRVARVSGFVCSILESFALKRVCGTFANSRHTEALVRKRTPQTWLVPNPIRSSFLKAPLANRAEKIIRVPKFLCVGRIDENKRQVEILRAFQRLYREGHRFVLQFAGPESSYEPWGAALGEVEGGDYVEQLGFLDEPSLIAAMDQADALVHFPLEESFGLVVGEALGREMAVFASDVGGVRDICDGVPGTCLVDSVVELEEEIADWIGRSCPNHPGANPIMALRYSPAVVAARHLDIYREILNEEVPVAS
ncbi:glycosyltransferase family 4 protein [Akkermansiaceae bacterium]|nr:glycosyltransferase family 4 protein [Akkermansiaceae bacterium]MDB4282185.1 glycosyltransferase family 4 protein [Akkermansiaceae bacterium]MDB4804670.1 glycosyltransferase family 4 protein [Akkermansiaceae bacterium]MDC0286847.1 glycosyltransferase family 4 protein [Akkermansiaceae bacterium]